MKFAFLMAALLAISAGATLAQNTPGSSAAGPIDSVERLGEALFSDPLLSGDRQTSCATCHKPELLFTDGIPRPTGGLKRIMGGRNTPTLLGVGGLTHFFWDGGVASLEIQAGRVLRSPIELDRNIPELLNDLNGVARYREASQRLFGTPVTEAVITSSLAQFQRTLRRRDTPYDLFLAGDTKALQGEALEGYRLFSGKAGCAQCHAGPDLTDSGFHTLGVPPDGPLRDDWGRYGITKDPQDMHKFKTPTLKGVTHTAPYMHNGGMVTLEDVLRFKNNGCGSDPNLSPHCRPLGLSPAERSAILAFLQTL
jgi:cytochrome c peroxidase